MEEISELHVNIELSSREATTLPKALKKSGTWILILLSAVALLFGFLNLTKEMAAVERGLIPREFGMSTLIPKTEWGLESYRIYNPFDSELSYVEGSTSVALIDAGEEISLVQHEDYSLKVGEPLTKDSAIEINFTNLGLEKINQAKNGRIKWNIATTVDNSTIFTKIGTTPLFFAMGFLFGISVSKTGKTKLSKERLPAPIPRALF